MVTDLWPLMLVMGELERMIYDNASLMGGMEVVEDMLRPDAPWPGTRWVQGGGRRRYDILRWKDRVWVRFELNTDPAWEEQWLSLFGKPYDEYRGLAELGRSPTDAEAELWTNATHMWYMVRVHGFSIREMRTWGPVQQWYRDRLKPRIDWGRPAAPLVGKEAATMEKWSQTTVKRWIDKVEAVMRTVDYRIIVPAPELPDSF